MPVIRPRGLAVGRGRLRCWLERLLGLQGFVQLALVVELAGRLIVDLVAGLVAGLIAGLVVDLVARLVGRSGRRVGRRFAIEHLRRARASCLPSRFGVFAVSVNVRWYSSLPAFAESKRTRLDLELARGRRHDRAIHEPARDQRARDRVEALDTFDVAAQLLREVLERTIRRHAVEQARERVGHRRRRVRQRGRERARRDEREDPRRVIGARRTQTSRSPPRAARRGAGGGIERGVQWRRRASKLRNLCTPDPARWIPNLAQRRKALQFHAPYALVTDGSGSSF